MSRRRSRRPRAIKLVDRNRQLLLGVLSEILLDQTGSKAVEARLDGSMGRKEIAGPRDGNRNVEWLAAVVHVGAARSSTANAA